MGDVERSRQAGLSDERASWDGVVPDESTQRRVGARTDDDLEPPSSIRATTASAPAVSLADLDFEDVGPTELQEGLVDRAEEAVSDIVGFEPMRAGETLGRYRIERMLGRGATGIVYEASHSVVGRRVALKCLFPHMAVVPVQVQRLFREARIAATVEHPNVVQVFDGGRDKDTYFLAMELLEGRTLAELLEEGPPALGMLIDIFAQVMSGVAAVHGEGVVHRDLKPDNIYMQMKPEDPLHPGIPKVLDFGVSKLYESDDRPRSKLTVMGMVMGTPYYMAPEQVADTSGVDQRADVFSLGVMLYEAITGQLPYEGNSVVEIFTLAQEGRPTPMRELRTDVPPSLEALVARAMCADKDARFESVDAMRDALLAVSLDGSDRAEDWSDVSEPWMFDKSSGVVRKDRRHLEPLGVEPTKAMAEPPRPLDKPIPGPTPLTNPMPPTPVPSVPAAAGGGAPTWVWLLVAAAAGGLFALAGAAGLYFYLAS